MGAPAPDAAAAAAFALASPRPTSFGVASATAGVLGGAPQLAALVEMVVERVKVSSKQIQESLRP